MKNLINRNLVKVSVVSYFKRSLEYTIWIHAIKKNLNCANSKIKIQIVCVNVIRQILISDFIIDSLIKSKFLLLSKVQLNNIFYCIDILRIEIRKMCGTV